MSDIRIGFFGTPELASKVLSSLIEEFPVKLVVTKPDRVRGRGRKITPTPVKQLALEKDIPFITPGHINENFCDWLRNYEITLIVVVAFGVILPEQVIRFPRYGSVNLHASLLPEFRGASPIQSAILHGLTRTGITIQLMESRLDTGAILGQREIIIGKDITAEDLVQKVMEIAPSFMIDTLRRWLQGEIVPQPQDDSNATYCTRITKEDGRINWKDSGELIIRKIRAFNIWPVAYTHLDGKLLRIFKGFVYSQQNTIDTTPGTIIGIKKQAGILVKTGRGVVALTDLQLENKRRMSYMEFANGYRNIIGKTFEF